MIHIRNVYSQPLTAFLLELVDYPGSSFSFSHDSFTSGIPAGAEKEFPVSNMTIGAAPDYVKVQAALYADGSTSGVAEKIAQLIAHRRGMLQTTREVISRIEKAQSSGVSKASLIADLKQWAEAIGDRTNRRIVTDAIGDLDEHSIDAALETLRSSERAIAATKPYLLSK